MKHNVVSINKNLVTPQEAAESLLSNIEQVTEVYIVAFIDGRPRFICSGDVQGSVFSAECLKNYAMGLVTG